MKFFEKVAWYFVVAILVCIPVGGAVWKVVQNHQMASQGEVYGEFWLPEKSTVITDFDQWTKEIDKDEEEVFYVDAFFHKYQDKLAKEDHLVFVGPEHVSYRTRQGRAMIGTTFNPRSPGGVKILNVEHLGGGQLKWQVTWTIWDDFLCILGNLFLGFLIDCVLFIVFVLLVIILDPIFEGIVRNLRSWGSR